MANKQIHNDLTMSIQNSKFNHFNNANYGSIAKRDDDSVELVVKNTLKLKESKEANHKQSEIKLDTACRCRFSRIVFVLFIICSVDIITLFYMSESAIDCAYLSDPSYVIIPILCLLSTTILAISAWNLYFRPNDIIHTRSKTDTTKAVIIYFGAIVVHSILFWYEDTLISNTQVIQNCIGTGIDGNIMMIKYALMIKGILFTLVFVISFIYNLSLRLFSNTRRCVMFIICFVSLIVIILMILVMINAAGVPIHSVGVLFGLLHIKCHCCSVATSSTSINTISNTNGHDVTIDYVSNAKSHCVGCPKVCRGGFCCHNGCHGCCGCKCKSGACCVVFYWNVFKCQCGSNGDYPDSLCCSFCGMTTTFCCNPGGCMGCCACSQDYWTWC